MLMKILENKDEFQPGLSIDCVIFGFHNNQLKVLLNKTKYSDQWALPGGFVPVDEDLEPSCSLYFVRTNRSQRHLPAPVCHLRKSETQPVRF